MNGDRRRLYVNWIGRHGTWHRPAINQRLPYASRRLPPLNQRPLHGNRLRLATNCRLLQVACDAPYFDGHLPPINRGALNGNWNGLAINQSPDSACWRLCPVNCRPLHSNRHRLPANRRLLQVACHTPYVN